jgi:hypothetical protein
MKRSEAVVHQLRHHAISNWQKGRVIKNPAHPGEIGKTFWVDGRIRTPAGTFDMDDGSPSEGTDSFSTNLLDGRGGRVAYYAEWVELLPQFSPSFPGWDIFSEWSVRP